MDADVIIVGAGISGLCCARQLESLGLTCHVLESSNGLGGRVRTDSVNGFLLDRGFQVFLTAYPEARRILDFDALKLKHFSPGALIRDAERFHSLYDPFKNPTKILHSLLSPVGSLNDKLRIALLRYRVQQGQHEELFRRSNQSSLETLKELKFSDEIIRKFFRPFLGGIFLEDQLSTPSGMFEFVFRMFSQGSAALPSHGMGAIPDQIASKLPIEWIQTNTPVHSVKNNSVQLSNGEILHAKAIVLATPSHITENFLGLTPKCGRRVTCLYYDALIPPIIEPILVLNGEHQGPINNMSVPSQINSNYAPENTALVSVTVLGGLTIDLERQVRSQLKSWFGKQTNSWSLIKTYDINHALPIIPSFFDLDQSPRISDTIFVSGDYRSSPSLQGAMISGRQTANAVASFLH